MSGAKSRQHARAIDLVAGAAALILASTALPVWAQATILAPQPSDPVFNAPLHPDASAPAHRMKLEVPRSLMGDQNAAGPKLSIELAYGGAQPLDPTAKLPDGPWGHTDLRAIKAGISLGF